MTKTKTYERATTRFFLTLRGAASVNDLPSADWDIIDLAHRIDREVEDIRRASAKLAKDMAYWTTQIGGTNWSQSCPLTSSTVAEIPFRAGRLDGSKETLFLTLRRMAGGPGSSGSDEGKAAFKTWADEAAASDEAGVPHAKKFSHP